MRRSNQKQQVGINYKQSVKQRLNPNKMKEQAQQFGQQSYNSYQQFQNSQQQQQQYYSQSSPTQPKSSNKSNQKPVKMIEFIDSLYLKYKILNKLSQQQSNQFQTQIITMLIDQNQCLDLQLYQQTVQKIGLSTFLLEILGTILQKRNKFKNQYQMNKNIQEIANQLDKQKLQLTKRKKELDKKQLTLNKQKQAIFIILQQKAKQIEQKTTKNILAIEQDIKKRVKSLITSLKAKQKEVTDKLSTMREGVKKIKQLSVQQKNIDEKLKLLQKKQKQRKIKQGNDKQQLINIQQGNKRTQQMNTKITTLQQVNKKLQQQIVRLNKKMKTNQMASKHYKDDMQKKVGKYNELNQRITLLERQKKELSIFKEQMQSETQQLKRQNIKLIKQNDSMKEQKNMMTKQMVSRNKQLERIKKSNIKNQLIVDELRRQNDKLAIKLKQITTNTNYLTDLINSKMILSQFQSLDISRIAPSQSIIYQSKTSNIFNQDNQLTQIKQDTNKDIIYQHKKLTTNNTQDFKRQSQQKYCIRQKQQQYQKQKQQYSIIHQVNDSFIVNNQYQHQINKNNHKNNQLLQMSCTVDVLKQMDYQKSFNKKDNEQNWFEDIKYNNKSLVINQWNRKDQSYVQEQQQQQTYKMTLPLRQIRNQLYQQQQQQQEEQQDQQQQQVYMKKYNFQSNGIQQQNVVLFDNYFNTKPTQNINKSNNNNNSLSLISKKSQLKPILINTHDNILSQINHIVTINSCQSLNTLSQPTLLNWIQTISYQLKYPKTLIQPILQLLLYILQPCTCTYHHNALYLLFSPLIITFLQQTLLKFQPIIPNIQSNSILILSRILLSYQNTLYYNNNQKQYTFTLKPNYLKSLKVKSLIEKDQFILSNIHYLLNYQ